MFLTITEHVSPHVELLPVPAAGVGVKIFFIETEIFFIGTEINTVIVLTCDHGDYYWVLS